MFIANHLLITFLFYSVALILCQIDSGGWFSVTFFLQLVQNISIFMEVYGLMTVKQCLYVICPLKGESEIRETIINNLKHEKQRVLCFTMWYDLGDLVCTQELSKIGPGCYFHGRLSRNTKLLRENNGKPHLHCCQKNLHR